MTDIKIEACDADAWERFGPEVFHLQMTGAELLARHRIAERARIVAWLRSEVRRLEENSDHDYGIGAGWYDEAAMTIARGDHITTGQEEGA